jgi:hypothetical protein
LDDGTDPQTGTWKDRSTGFWKDMWMVGQAGGRQKGRAGFVERETDGRADVKESIEPSTSLGVRCS